MKLSLYIVLIGLPLVLGLYLSEAFRRIAQLEKRLDGLTANRDNRKTLSGN
jgi:hypothetical protein